ncbi:hypothetical protein G3R49_12700 [Shewanella sp. WXL01]|uniref:Uncharacterized protein n=1 Tax=Shewanella maritima TaxID=2520507 RepID=A0A411PJV2_9GAMM|nr:MULTISPECIES: hypothetical protein [Shewanella]NKF51418.1 hypothetical protein [Shewanella sp. WXL01]QBF83670.1 hypothetical protein EXU30_13915 [Shewanella maritima]
MSKTLSRYSKQINDKILLVVGFIAGLLLIYLVLQRWADSREIYQFECQAEAYKVDIASLDGDPLRGNLILKLEVREQHLVLTYYSAFEETIREFVAFEGELQELEVGSMTYKIDFEAIEVNLQPNSQLYPYLTSELDMADKSLAYGYKFTQHLSVIDMDSKLNFMLVKFTPSASLWACSRLNLPKKP